MKHKAKLVKAVTVIGLIGTIAFIIYGIHLGIFTSQKELKLFLGRCGSLAPVVFVIFQAVQVVVPILPGGIGCLGGVLIFGPLKGFIYNYIGICFGSFCAFLLARKYGKPFVKEMTNENTYRKYEGWLEKGAKFDKFFAVAIFMPVAPDDFLCYLAGLTKMRSSRFLKIIILGKPFAIAAYSFGLNVIAQQVFKLIG